MSSNFNFDILPNRENTGSLKWEKYKSSILPMWVADMDFEAAPEIINALKTRINHKIFGYTIPYHSVIESIICYLKSEHQYHIEKNYIKFLPGLVPAINLCCRAFSQPNESIMIATPVYPPFIHAPKYANRELISTPLMLENNSKWTFDFELMENSIKQNTKIFILCNPHNPTGRVYSKTELNELAAFCIRHDLILISDEIHCDLIFDISCKHTVAASISDELENRTITLMSPSKTYNIPGLSCAYSIIKNPELRHRFDIESRGIITEINCFGYVACEAAYNHGSLWRKEMIRYLNNNYNLIKDYLSKCIPEIKLMKMEATYLAWLKVDDLPIKNTAKFFEEHGVGLSDGAAFGDPKYLRFNFGCSKHRVLEALERMHQGIVKEKLQT